MGHSFSIVLFFIKKVLLDISILHFRGEDPKDYENNSRKTKVQPVLLPNSWIHIFPIFLMEWLEIKMVF